jgi:ribosomal protein S18 acetylase RimI-like enzyme
MRIWLVTPVTPRISAMCCSATRLRYALRSVPPSVTQPFSTFTWTLLSSMPANSLAHRHAISSPAVDQRSDSYVIAERGGTFTGYCFWEIHEADAVLASIYVLPDERGRGLGRHLLAAYVSDGQSTGFRRFTLGVRPDNPARLLYETAGFSYTHDDRGYRQ